MSDVIGRIKSLIDRAAHEGTPEEESRSCAVIAVKLIKKHNLSVGSSKGLSPEDELLLNMIKRERARREAEQQEKETEWRAREKRERDQEACKADRKKRRPVYADKPCPACGKCH